LEDLVPAGVSIQFKSMEIGKVRQEGSRVKRKNIDAEDRRCNGMVFLFSPIV
jgi:hypothetical protein